MKVKKFLLTDNVDINYSDLIIFEEKVELDDIRAAVDKSIFLDETVLKFAFKYFDTNNSGEITYESIKSIFKEHIKSASIDESLKKIMDEVDKNKDGKINYDDFCELMKKIL